MNIARLFTFSVSLLILSLLAGCGSSSDISGVPATPPIELNVWLFPGSGLEPMIDKYKKMHPELSIRLQTSAFAELPEKLQTTFAADYGAPDIVLIEKNYFERFKSFQNYFYNLASLGALDLRSNYLDWNWKQTLSADETFVFGLPTDIGPYAMVYRNSLFQAAGLPTDPDEVAKKLATWDQFMEAGKRIHAITGKAMVNDLETLYLVILGQSPQQYYDPSTGYLSLENNLSVSRAWDYSMEAATNHLSATTKINTREWSKGLEQGDFAVSFTPSWLIGNIKVQAPKADGLWNITQVPEGGANRGGSFLSLPKNGQHPKESFEFIKWLTASEQQTTIFHQSGNFPSTPISYNDPGISDWKDTFYNNAPIGRIYTDAAKQIKPAYFGPLHQTIENDIIVQLLNVDKNLKTHDAAWRDAVEQIKKDIISK